MKMASTLNHRETLNLENGNALASSLVLLVPRGDAHHFPSRGPSACLPPTLHWIKERCSHWIKELVI